MIKYDHAEQGMATFEKLSIGRKSPAATLDVLRHLWREGLQSDSIPLDPDDIKRRGRERLARNSGS